MRVRRLVVVFVDSKINVNSKRKVLRPKTGLRMTRVRGGYVRGDATTKVERSVLQASLGRELFHQRDLAAVVDAMLNNAVQQRVIVMVPLWDHLFQLVVCDRFDRSTQS